MSNEVLIQCVASFLRTYFYCESDLLCRHIVAQRAFASGTRHAGTQACWVSRIVFYLPAFRAAVHTAVEVNSNFKCHFSIMRSLLLQADLLSNSFSNCAVLLLLRPRPPAEVVVSTAPKAIASVAIAPTAHAVALNSRIDLSEPGDVPVAAATVAAPSEPTTSSATATAAPLKVSLISFAQFHSQLRCMEEGASGASPPVSTRLGDCVLSIHESSDSTDGTSRAVQMGACATVLELLSSLSIADCDMHARAFATAGVELADLPFLSEADFALLLPPLGARRRLQAWLRFYYQAQVAEASGQLL